MQRISFIIENMGNVQRSNNIVINIKHFVIDNIHYGELCNITNNRYLYIIPLNF